MKKIIFLTILFSLAQWTWAQNSLCKPKEEVLFSCNIGKKTASLCGSNSKKSAYYIFGTKKRTELLYKADANKKFFQKVHRTTDLDSGNVYDGRTARFLNGETEYIIYSHSFEDQVEESGIHIKDNGKSIADLSCSNVYRTFHDVLGYKNIFVEDQQISDFITQYQLTVKDESPEEFNAFVDQDTKLMQLITIPLSTGQNAVLMILERIDWLGADSEQRYFKVIQKNNEGAWQVTINKDKNILLCSTCGGVLGDPKPEIKRGIDSFSIYYEVGSNTIYRTEWHYRYNLKNNEWYLASYYESSQDRINPDQSTAATYNYPEELRYIQLKDINIHDGIKKYLKGE